MRKTFTLFTMMAMATAAFAVEEAEAPEYSQVALVEAIKSSQSAMFGYAVTAIGNTGKFAVSAAGNGTVANSRYVNIYSFDNEGKTVLDQTINEPAEGTKFFGYKLSATNDVLAVATSTLKKAYFYKKDGDSFASTPFAELDLTNTPSSMKISGNYFAYSTLKDGVQIYSVDVENEILTKVFQDAETSESVKSIDMENGTLVTMMSETGIALYKEKDGEWSKVHYEATPHGNKAEGGICLSGENIFVGMPEGLLAMFYDGDSFVSFGDMFIEKPSEEDNLMFGYCVAANNKYAAILTNNNATMAKADCGYIYKIDQYEDWNVFGRINAMNGEGEDAVKEKVMSACFVGDRLIYANQSHEVEGLTNAGGFFVFDFDSKLPEVQAISNLFAEAKGFDVFDLSGKQLRKDAATLDEALSGLKRGVYVVNGQKVRVK